MLSIVVLSKNDTVKNLIEKIEQQFEQTLQSAIVTLDNVNIKPEEKLNKYTPYKYQEILHVVCKVDTENKSIEICSDIEYQTFAYKDTEQTSLWKIDQDFYKDNTTKTFPQQISLWNNIQVNHWLNWATPTFNLDNEDSNTINDLTGEDLYNLNNIIFKNELFKIYFNILLYYNLVCIPMKFLEKDKKRIMKFIEQKDNSKILNSTFKKINLWEFLLKLLVNKDYKNDITWVDDNGKFKVLNCEKIAELWKIENKLTQCKYDSLHKIIARGTYKDVFVAVPKEKITYQFVIEIDQLLGMTPSKVNQLRNGSN